jgi:Lipocalin-like domain
MISKFRRTLMISFLTVFTFAALSALAQSAPGSHPNRQTLLGAWRLVSIAYSGPNGALVDPVFGANSQGLIIYDPSGWMSVQIFSPDRPTMPRPASRITDSAAAVANSVKAAAFDSYYAYFGTWEYDYGTATITHHLKSSLLPYETGVDYRRSVSISGGRLELTVSNQVNGESRKRVLIWERAASGSQ